MPSLKTFRLRIRSVQSTQKITKELIEIISGAEAV